MLNRIVWLIGLPRLSHSSANFTVIICTFFAILLILGCACSKSPSGRGAGEVVASSNTPVKFKVETVLGNLEVPWSIVWAPDGRMFFTERPGRVRIFENGKLLPQPVFTVPDVESSGEGGLLSLTFHPQFSTNHFVYIAYAYKTDGLRVRVVRYREAATGFTDRKIIIEDIPAAKYHAGCRIRFGPDGKLFITTGDATDRALAQRLDSLAGKTLRVNDDGSIPSDNPLAGQPGARGEIWTIGHRNSQGLDWQPGSDLMFQTEHGPSGFDGPEGGDEVNIVERGNNYGWPIIHHKETREGLVSPLIEYTPACAPGSASFYRGRVFQQFEGNLFFGCLRGERIVRVVLDGRRVVSQENLLEKQYGRIRDVAEGPDGYIYFSTSNRDGRGSPAADDDRIIRLVPTQ